MKPLVALVVLLGCLANSAQAQEAKIPRSLMVRGGFSVPTGASSAEYKPAAPTAGVRFQLPVTSFASGYFSVDGSRAGYQTPRSGRSSLLSAAVGASLSRPVGTTLDTRTFVDIGASLNRWYSDARALDSEQGAHSDWSPGLDAAVGIQMPATARIGVIPALRYRSFKPELAGFDFGRVSTVSFEVGISFRN